MPAKSVDRTDAIIPVPTLITKTRRIDEGHEILFFEKESFVLFVCLRAFVINGCLDLGVQSAISPVPTAGQSPGERTSAAAPQTITPIHMLSETTATSFAVRGASGGAFGAVARPYVVM